MIEELSLGNTTAVLRLLAMLIVATMVHELGHAGMARLLRIPIRRIAIGLGPVIWRRQLRADREFLLRAFPVGAMIGLPSRLSPSGESSRPLYHDVCVAASGPVINLLLFVGLAVVDGAGVASPAVLPWLRTLALLSAFLGISNLLPIPGLDGGHILMLGVSKLGLRLSPRQQVVIQQMGLRLVVALCCGVLFARLMRVL
ncbi:MAG: site-2 protease family protein [Anaerolineae bacterium]|nr:site-2 protease family protein [Anaerolineae bacterium]